MSFEQIAIFALLAAMMVAFAMVRRFEIVALSGLAVSGLVGLVPVPALFSGFSSATVVTVVEILLIVEVLKRSAILDAASDRLGGLLSDDRTLIIGLCAIGAFASVFMNNIGALALMLPLSVSLCERRAIALERVLMPISFATLLGGLCSLVGTPANLLGSTAVAEVRGTPLGFFELGIVGVPLTLVGLLYLWFVIPRTSRRQSDPVHGHHARNYLTELTLPPASPLAGMSLGEIEARHGVTIHNIVRNGAFVFGRKDKRVEPADILVIEASQEALAALDGPLSAADAVTIEAVVLPESIYVGSAIEDMVAFEQAGVRISALGITPRRVEARLSDARLSVGDIVVFTGDPTIIARECAESGMLQIAPAAAHRPRPDFVPLAIFAVGVIAAAFGGVQPVVAFGLVVLVLALTRHLSLRQGFEGLNWPILILLGAMIPLGGAVADTGAAEALARFGAGVAPTAGLAALVAVMLVSAVILTPFVNNPTTVLVLAPVGVAFAEQYGVPATPVLIAITIGASLDFLTPIGHHNNTLVMGIAGYRFFDYARLGWPLTVMSILISLAMITFAYG
ncbi:SLC13 family permease [Pelagibacterium luteolum]|uniref:Di-and tricarboxylate transporter n=1 Tax=Pelagibacterium luteolum TaxID=440168 RepID=A0A1G7TCC7_9HYPH|nr:SLC13 family permease [Pelagibacterium luteolum]SDG32953.1 Di-and tricarboxylate transporter [Pelagibacterium luteolum]